jgi:hypothetical protein
VVPGAVDLAAAVASAARAEPAQALWAAPAVQPALGSGASRAAVLVVD